MFVAVQGRSGITQIEGFPCEDYSTRFAGEIKGFDPTGYIDKKNARRMDSCIKYTMVAGKKVWWLLPLSSGLIKASMCCACTFALPPGHVCGHKKVHT